MRIRRKTWARPELSACPYFIAQPEQQKGRWEEVYGQQRPLHLDLGCGKCVFLAEAARTHRDVNFIGIDISLDILGVARRNIAEIFGEEQPDNVALCAYNIERLPQLFSPEEKVQRIYLATKRYLTEAGFEIFFDTKDLHAQNDPENILTEHEVLFTAQGIPTKALRARLPLEQAQPAADSSEA